MPTPTSINKFQGGSPIGGLTNEALIKNSNTDYDYSWATIPPAPASNGLPMGGTIGQILVKNSSTDYDASFLSLSSPQVITALGYTPYDSTNPSGFITPSSTSTLTNKSGNISQWTNDSGYLTAVTGITAGGDLTGTYPNPTIANSVVTEAMQILSNNTTNNVSISKHGYAPILPNDATKFLDGTGAYSVPPGTGGSGSVTTVSVVSANGFAGTVATATTTPAITLSTSITGIIKGDGTAISAATAGTDYVTASSTNTFTNKSGNVSQFTNDSGYVTATSSTAFTNKTGNISQWTNDSGYITSSGGGVSSGLAVATSELSLGSSTTETDIIPDTVVTGGLLTAGHCLRVELFIIYTVSNSSASNTFRLYYGGSVVGTFSLGGASTSPTQTGHIVFTIAYVGASSQYISGVAITTGSGTGTAFASVSEVITGTSAINSASNQNIKVTTQGSASNTLTLNKVEGALIQFI